MNYELVIKNGTLVTEEGEKELDLAVEKGKIVRLGQRGSLKGGEEIDARGLLVFPGGIDTHVHFEDPGMTDWEDWEHASLAAAKGGITTVVDMPVDNVPPTIDGETLLFKKKAAQAKSSVDFCLWGGLTQGAQLDEMLDGGAVGFKAFLAECGGPYFPVANNGTLYEGMRVAAKRNSLVTLHCEDIELVNYYTKLYRDQNALDSAAWGKTRPLLCELLAVHKVLYLARLTGARINIAHISSSEVAALVDEGKKQGLSVTAETCAHYLHFSGEDVVRRGVMLKCSPPIREQERELLWECVKDGRIDFVASDHSPASAEMKTLYMDDMDKGCGGISGVQFTLNVLFSDGVQQHGLTLSRLASVFSANAARTLGIYGIKGALREGFDADLVLFDPQKVWTAQSEDYLAKVPISPYIGETFQGAVEATYVRGVCVYQQGTPVRPQSNFGRMLPTANIGNL